MMGVRYLLIITFLVFFTPFALAVAESNVGITVNISGPPFLEIIRPENGTYITNNIPLQYLVSSGSNLIYNLNLINNVTITNQNYFSAPNGGNTFYLYANNSYGITLKNVTFTVDPAIFTILYSEYNGSTKGSSTNLTDIIFENMGDVEDIILENTKFGKIKFNEEINLTNDSIPEDSILDLDTHTHISLHSIFVDSDFLPNFNKKATLYFYNLTFSDPEVKVNGVECPVSICTKISYTNGTYILNVTEFSIYTIEETSISLIPFFSGGGGGGGNTVVNRDLDIFVYGKIEFGKNDSTVIPIGFRNPEKIKLSKIKIRANSSYEIDAKFEYNDINSLSSGENQTVMLFLETDGVLSPGTYEIEIIAEVSDPKFIKSETIHISLVERLDLSRVVEKISLVKDLFSQNPVCLELNDLLIEAQRLLDEGKVEEAGVIVKDTINKCKGLLTETEAPFNYSNLNNWQTPTLWILVLIIIALIISAFLTKPKFNLKKPRRKTLLQRYRGYRRNN